VSVYTYRDCLVLTSLSALVAIECELTTLDKGEVLSRHMPNNPHTEAAVQVGTPAAVGEVAQLMVHHCTTCTLMPKL
jgi:hypothetical protein